MITKCHTEAGRAANVMRSVRALMSVSFAAISMVTTTGCTQLATTWATMSGGDWIDAEFRLTRGPLLILVDDRDSQMSDSRAIGQVHKTLSDQFLEFKVNQNVLPYAELQRLQQSDRTYERLSIRQIGEKLGAEQIVYLRVEKFTLQSEPGAPLFKGEFVVRVKVLSTDRKNEVRLWPDEESGKRVSVTTRPISSDGEKTPGDVAKELAEKLAKEVAKIFYGHRELES